ncbi:MAG TPA: helix-turn-helix domain-containing protein [Acidobacteriota bacterium]|nr:helix-turn-helix domain-containing protein [Acidobacteriota bacterium]
MIYEQHRPAGPLGQFVEFFWFHEGYDPGHTREKVLPDGSIELIIDLEDTPKRLYASEDSRQATEYRGAWISGEQKEYIVIEASPHSSMAGIHFRPGGAWPFFDFPISELTNQVVQLDLIWGRNIARLREQLLEAKSVEVKFQVMEAFLLGLAKDRLEPDCTIAFAVEKITRRPQHLIIGDLIEEVGYSHRHFLSRFKKQVGVTPKFLTRVFKFQHVLRSLDGFKSTDINWAELSFDWGYYDQAHFINDFRSLSGLRPTEYLERWWEYPNFLPLDLPD